ncbi:MAG: hypothetical protein RL748_3317, partial [Pseudomonadota bacterium]
MVAHFPATFAPVLRVFQAISGETSRKRLKAIIAPMKTDPITILILYYSRHGATRQLAQLIAQGVESVPGVDARLRTVPAVSTVAEATESAIPDQGSPYVELLDLR